MKILNNKKFAYIFFLGLFFVFVAFSGLNEINEFRGKGLLDQGGGPLFERCGFIAYRPSPEIPKIIPISEDISFGLKVWTAYMPLPDPPLVNRSRERGVPNFCKLNIQIHAPAFDVEPSNITKEVPLGRPVSL